MQVEEAIASAKIFFQKVFAEEQVSQMRLEEVEFDDGDQAWLVTLSAVLPAHAVDKWSAMLDRSNLQRTYKTVNIDDVGGRLPSVKIRQIHGAA